MSRYMDSLTFFFRKTDIERKGIFAVTRHYIAAAVVRAPIPRHVTMLLSMLHIRCLADFRSRILESPLRDLKLTTYPRGLYRDCTAPWRLSAASIAFRSVGMQEGS
jgi:hypothetical protein